MKKTFSLIIALLGLSCVAQNRVIDSLTSVVNAGNSDTSTVIALNLLSRAYYKTGHQDSAMSTAKRALVLSEACQYINGMGESYNNIGNIYNEQGSYPEALKYYLMSLEVREKLGDKKGIGNSLSNIGIIYKNQNSYKKAIEYTMKALSLRASMNDKQGMAISYVNLGHIYSNMNKYPEAIKNAIKSLELFESIGDKYGAAKSHTNIGTIYWKRAKYDSALKEHFEALRLREQIGDRNGIAGSLVNIGAIYMSTGQYKKAEKYTKESLNLYTEINNLHGIQDANEILYDIYQKTNRPTLALEHYKLFIAARDSLINEDYIKKLVQLEMNFEFSKKEATARTLAVAERKKQRIILLSICAVLLLISIFTVFMYRSYLHKRRAHAEISRQKEIIEDKQNEILASIRYAKKIQESLLTSEGYISRNLNRLCVIKKH